MENYCIQNPRLATLDVHDVTRDGRHGKRPVDIDDKRIDLSMERHNNRIVATVQHKKIHIELKQFGQ